MDAVLREVGEAVVVARKVAAENSFIHKDVPFVRVDSSATRVTTFQSYTVDQLKGRGAITRGLPTPVIRRVHSIGHADCVSGGSYRQRILQREIGVAPTRPVIG